MTAIELWTRLYAAATKTERGTLLVIGIRAFGLSLMVEHLGAEGIVR